MQLLIKCIEYAKNGKVTGDRHVRAYLSSLLEAVAGSAPSFARMTMV